jgi:DNA-directed RNA polymerase specialized sigma24 family protein
MFGPSEIDPLSQPSISSPIGKLFMEIPLLPNRPDPHAFLWISPVDDENVPVDPVFLDAAYQIGIDFFLYRARELNDPARIPELVERAVHSASRARKRQPVRDPLGYLWCTFTRLVEHELSRARRFEPLIEQAAVGCSRSSNPETELQQSLEWREILDQVDPTMRWVLWQLLWGYSIKEIAGRLGVKPDTLSKRLSRTREQLQRKLQKKRIDPQPPSAGRSRGNGEKGKGR